MKWKYVGSSYDDSFVLNGIDLFEQDWVSTGETIKVRDPIYGETKILLVWNIKVNDIDMTFAAGEFSNNVWGFYTKS